MKVQGVFRSADAVRDLPAGTVIFSEGEPGEEMYGVVEGQVEIRLPSGFVRTIGPDESFGELALVDHSTRSGSAVAVTDVKLAVINRQSFLYLVHETPMFALQVMSSIAERLRDAH